MSTISPIWSEGVRTIPSFDTKAGSSFSKGGMLKYPIFYASTGSRKNYCFFLISSVISGTQILSGLQLENYFVAGIVNDNSSFSSLKSSA